MRGTLGYKTFSRVRHPNSADAVGFARIARKLSQFRRSAAMPRVARELCVEADAGVQRGGVKHQREPAILVRDECADWLLDRFERKPEAQYFLTLSIKEDQCDVATDSGCEIRAHRHLNRERIVGRDREARYILRNWLSWRSLENRQGSGCTGCPKRLLYDTPGPVVLVAQRTDGDIGRSGAGALGIDAQREECLGGIRRHLAGAGMQNWGTLFTEELGRNSDRNTGQRPVAVFGYRTLQPAAVPVQSQPSLGGKIAVDQPGHAAWLGFRQHVGGARHPGLQDRSVWN
jgi:hypothetical protein